jgi:hypothetical protein
MPEFGSPFSGLVNARKLTHEELIRPIRFMVAAEYEALWIGTTAAVIGIVSIHPFMLHSGIVPE